jgi:DNA-binding transcriptional LysR family regulator
MNLTWLEDFLTLAATGNFSRAAEQRHLTQPAFSRRIRALEDWLGVALFDRASHPTMLTPSGLWFKDVSKNLLDQAAQLPEQAQAIASSRSSSLRFAATHALSLTFLPKWLRGLETKIPLGPIQLVSDVLQQCEALMQQNKVHFVLCHAHASLQTIFDINAYASVIVGTDTLIPVCANRLAGKKPLLDDPQKKPISLLQYSNESGLSRIVKSTQGSALEKLSADTVFTAHLATVLKTMALGGRGVAWLPTSLIEEDLNEGRLIKAGIRKWDVDVEIRLFRKLKAESEIAETLWLAAGGSSVLQASQPKISAKR